MTRPALLRLICILPVLLVLPFVAAANEVRDVRLGAHPGYVRVVVETAERPVFRTLDTSAEKETVLLELSGATGGPPSLDVPEDAGPVIDHHIERHSSPPLYRLYLRTKGQVRLETMTLQNPWRVVLDVHEDSATAVASAGAVALPAIPSATIGGFRPRVIVIDPGHGGKHRGGLGRVNGRRVTEADLTLPVARRIERLLDADPRFVPLLTRRSDTYVGLRERTRLAEQASGNLFLSLHYNAVPPSKPPRSARGLEFWVWSPREVDSAAEKYLMNLDNEEGSDTTVSGAAPEARQVLSSMLMDALQEQALESRQLADALERAFLRDSLFKSHYRGIKSGRFKVLENYNMPSVLVEIGFISHPTEAKLATQADYQERVARHIYNGVVAYYEATDPAFRAASRR